MNGDGFCECGCGGKTRLAMKTSTAQGKVKGEPQRFLLGHGTRKGVDVIEDPDTGCWIWQLGMFRTGYGSVWNGERNTVAHRVYYEDLIGPIPDGLTLDHLCRNRACCNPGHLEPVTMRENVLRGDSITGRNARKTHCLRGHPFDEQNTRIMKGGGRACRACDRERRAAA